MSESKSAVLSNLVSLQDKSIIVTGSGRGIGKAVAVQALALGASVTGVDLDGDALRGWMSEMDPSRVHAVAGNIVDPEVARTIVAEAHQKFGRIDGLVNNAGITRPAMIQKMSAEQWQSVIDVNLTGVFNCLQAVGGYMVDRAKEGAEPGAIVNVASDAGRRGTIGQVNYAASKAGVLGITMGAAREWARYGLRVNSVCFGVVETPMTETILTEKFRDRYVEQIPMGRWAQTGDVAPPVCFLLSAAAGYITGQHLSINGGYHIGF